MIATRRRWGVGLACLALLAPMQTEGQEPVASNATPARTVQQSREGFAARQNAILAKMARAGMTRDTYGDIAIAKLASPLPTGAPDTANPHADANAQLRRVAEWFDHPHPTGRDLRGEPDFAAAKLALAYHLFDPAARGKWAGRLEPATSQAVRRFFLTTDFQSMYHSENHHLLFRTSRYLMGAAYPGEKFAAYGNRTGAEVMAEDARWVEDFLRFRARRGWGEFDSSVYIAPDIECLLLLHDFAPDAKIRTMATMMLDLLIADAAVDSRRGMLGGANGRIYSPQARDHKTSSFYAIHYVYIGDADPGTVGHALLNTLVSDYQPDDLVRRIALERDAVYENRERKHLHNMSDVRPDKPLPGSIRKITRVTPDYLFGSVQLQDPYPADAPSRGYAGHQQHDWDLTVTTRTNGRIFTHHPGDFGEHNYWTGDLGCRCTHTFQNGTAQLALYDIPAKQPYQFIHAFLPRSAFAEIVEEDGIIFAREGRVYAALRLLGGHRWTSEGEWKAQEVISDGAKNGAVFEVATTDEYPDFAAFRKAVAATMGAKGGGVQFDPAAMRLTYRSTRSGTLTMDTRGLRQVDGKAVDLDYPTYGCPYLSSAWDSGVIEMKHGTQRRVLDFIAVTDRRR